jgi:nucleoside-diphosphate kinase
MSSILSMGARVTGIAPLSIGLSMARLFNPACPMLSARANLNPIPRTEQTDMATQRTFSIIKPDATKRNLTGAINAKFEEAGLRIIAQKRIHLTKAQAGVFYAVHKERPFYDELCEFMASEPVVVQVLEGEDAIAKNREVMGATNPAEAAPGTIRKEFALSSARTRSTAPTRRRPPPKRSRISSPGSNWSAD